MSNTAILNEKVLSEIEINCPECKSILRYIVSDTNSHYYYCSNCYYNKKKIDKHLAFDTILKSIQSYFSQKIDNNIDEVKICISKAYDYISLRIDNNEIVSVKLSSGLCDKDIKILNYIIEDLFEDYYGECALKSNVKIAI